MKIGVFSDIHGNYYAFEKVYQELIGHKCERYIFCGDVCGYYFSQNEVIDLLSTVPNLTAVAGNHDRMLLRCLEDERLMESYTEKYGTSMMLLKKNISRQSLKFLMNLPDHHIDGDLDMAVFHGSPWDYSNGYIYPADNLDKFSALPYRYVILGHTHYAMVKKVQDTYVINPGSSGQPRDGAYPSYGVLDSATGEVAIKRVPYDKDALIRDVYKYDGEHPYLVNVLQRGAEVS